MLCFNRKLWEVFKIIITAVIIILLLSLPGYTLEKKKININLKGVELRDALRTMAELSGINLITDGSVKGTITLHLKDITFDNAIKLISESRGLDWKYQGNTVFIASEERIKAMYNDYIIKKIEINNRKASDIKDIISAIFPEVKFGLDRSNNYIIFKGAKNKLKELTRLIYLLDSRQIEDTTKKTYKFFDIRDAKVKEITESLSLLYPNTGIISLEASDKILISGRIDNIKQIGKIIKQNFIEKKLENDIEKKFSLNPKLFEQLSSIIKNSGYEINIVYDKEKKVLHITGKKEEIDNFLKMLQDICRFKKSSQRIELKKLNYIELDEVKKLSSEIFPKIKTHTAYKRRMVTLRGENEEVDKFIKILDKIDRPRSQIIIEAKVIEISCTELKEMGIEPGQLSQINIISEDEKIVDLDLKWPELIKFMTESGKARTLAAPSLVTLNGEEAELLIGDKIPIKISKEDNEQIKYIEAGIRLEFLPIITEKEEIILTVNPRVSSIGEQLSEGLPAINTREAKTKIRLNNGEVFAIAGLIQEDIINSEKKIPILSEIPLFGSFFKSNNESIRKSEVIILIRPYIIDSLKKSKNNLSSLEGKRHVDIEEINVWRKKENFL